ncbi:MAG: alpha-galactosidase, partial [Clostridia bacterium]|nr:alpha-galactosidase [Clostridia bacterium]
YQKDEDKYNKFRKLMKNHFSYKCNRESLFANELWGGLPSEEMKKRLGEYKKYGIRFEDIWIDAGWYGRCSKCDEAFSGDWFKFTGEWDVNTRVHPGLLRDVADSAKECGANLMLWFEPERAVEGTKVPSEHPEWFLKLPGSDSLLLNYGNKEAFDYIYGVLSYYVKELGLSCYRQDFNIPLDALFKANETENRVGVLEIKHITGMYALWDKLHAEFPNLLIDNCSSGGRRFDIETLRRSIAFFRSDYQCNFNEHSDTLQSHNAGLSKYLPYGGCTSKTLGDTYAARSSFSPSWGAAFYNAVFQSMNEEDFKWAKEITEEYRRIRKYMSCNFHNHGAEVFDESAWAIWQYHDDETDSGIVMAFRRAKSPFDNVTLELKELTADKKYAFTNLNDFTEFEGSNKLKIELPEKKSSVVFEYKAK